MWPEISTVRSILLKRAHLNFPVPDALWKDWINIVYHSKFWLPMSIIQIIIQLGSHHLCQINYKNCQFILCYPWEKEGSNLSTLILLVSTKQQYLWISLAWTLQTLSQSSIQIKLIQHKRVEATSIWNKLTWAWVWAPLITSSVVSEDYFCSLSLLYHLWFEISRRVQWVPGCETAEQYASTG